MCVLAEATMVEMGGGGVCKWWGQLVLIDGDGRYFGCESNNK